MPKNKTKWTIRKKKRELSGLKHKKKPVRTGSVPVAQIKGKTGMKEKRLFAFSRKMEMK